MGKLAAATLKLGIVNNDKKIYYPDEIVIIDENTLEDKYGNIYCSIMEEDGIPVGFITSLDSLKDLYNEEDIEVIKELYIDSLNSYNVIKDDNGFKIMYNGDPVEVLSIEEYASHFVEHVLGNGSCSFDVKKLYDALKENVFEQDEAIKKIVVALSLHYNDPTEKHKSNIIIDGSKGTGKTTIINTLKEVLPVNVLVEDMGDPNFSFDALFCSLHNRDDICSCPILVLDNADKVLLNNDVKYADESISTIKKIMLGVDYKLQTANGTINCPTDDFVIILMGDFKERNRCGICNTIGGVPKELSVLTNYNIKLNPMNKKLVLKKLLNDKNGVFMHYTNYLNQMGVSLNKSDALIDKIVNETLKTNMHELDKIVEKCFEDVLFELYTTDNTYSEVSINSNTLKDSKKYTIK